MTKEELRFKMQFRKAQIKGMKAGVSAACEKWSKMKDPSCFFTPYL
jgi:hypothetical protein